jgi:hypothetical protein
VNTRSSGPRVPGLLLSAATLVVLAVAVLLAFFAGRERANRGLESAFESRVEKTRLASLMEARLLTSAEAEKSAVMADTDEASAEYAEAARQASAAVEADRVALGRLIDLDKQPGEVARFEAFSHCWETYRDIDREILGLAVENTNLKALRLSFGPATEALDRMQAALDKLVADSGNSTEAIVITRSSARVLTAALEIQLLESRHIAEARDEEMDRIEARLKELDAQVRNSLAELTVAAGETGKPSADEARAAYADFQNVNAELLRLSRRNSNVRSFAMSLGRKRKVTAECQDLLVALQEAIRSEKLKATR